VYGWRNDCPLVRVSSNGGLVNYIQTHCGEDKRHRRDQVNYRMPISQEERDDMMETAKTLAERVEEFKAQGYTLFEKVYTEAQMQAWREKHTELQQQEIRGDVASHPAWWFKDMVEHAPRLMLPAVANPTILEFAEAVMGPFVQLDNLTLAGFPSVSAEEVRGKVSGWHRDRWAQVPRGVYERPNAINAICYLQDLTAEFGPLRAIPGSHIRPMTLSASERGLPHPEEVIVPMQAGDVIVIHNCLLHSGTPNTSGQTRYFFSIFYNLTWLHHTDNHNGPNVQQIVQRARKQNDHRTLRLFAIDDHLEARANSGFLESDEARWATWIQADQEALA
jgi:ectoine hydroxylase-related dioxygenase (phytanoyl-CoA dioxygenase family)